MSVKQSLEFVALILVAGCSETTAPHHPYNAPMLIGNFPNGSQTFILRVRADSTGLDTIVSWISVPYGDFLNGISWAPDYKRFAYGRLPGIFVANADGSADTLVTPSTLGGAYPSWSPDGTHIVFVAYVNGVGCGLFVLDLTSSQVSTVVLPITSCVGQPAWSPDGQVIAYVCSTGSICLVHPDGSNRRTLFQTSKNVNEPAWAPNSRKLAFVSDSTGPTDVWTVNVVTGQLNRMTDATDSVDISPVWSPDGESLAFIRADRFGDNPGVRTIAANGGVPHLLIAVTNPSYLAW